MRASPVRAECVAAAVLWLLLIAAAVAWALGLFHQSLLVDPVRAEYTSCSYADPARVTRAPRGEP